MQQEAIMNLLIHNLGYVAVACVSIWLSGWLVYDRLMSRGYSLAKELFEKRNLAAAIEVGAFVAVQFLLAANALSGENTAATYLKDLEAVALTILISNLLFFLFRSLAAVFVKRRFTGQLDSHGEAVEYNNEIFGQQNLASALFSVSFMILTWAMIRQEDFLNMNEYRVEAWFNMAGVFLFGVFLFLYYRTVFIPKGHGLLRELFIDNNPAIGLSLCGFLLANFDVQALLIEKFTEGEHLFRTSWHVWADFALVLVFLTLARQIFAWLMGKFSGRSYFQEFVVEDNVVTGFLDLILFVSMARLLVLLM